MKLNSNDILLFSGDSITDGNRGRSMDCNHIMGHGFPSLIASRLALDNFEAMPKFVNKGYSGERMADLLEKYQEDVIANKPTIVNILAGVNDALFGSVNRMTPEQVTDNYLGNLITAVQLIKSKLPDTKIIICEPFYFPIKDKSTSFDFVPHPYCEKNNGRPDRDETIEQMEYRKETIKLIGKSAKEVALGSADVFVPLYDSFKNAISKSRTEYFTWDGVHPTIAGHMLIADEWFKAVENRI